MTYRSIHHGPVLRIAPLGALVVAAFAGALGLAVALSAAGAIGHTLSLAVAAISGRLA